LRISLWREHFLFVFFHLLKFLTALIADCESEKMRRVAFCTECVASSMALSSAYSTESSKSDGIARCGPYVPNVSPLPALPFFNEPSVHAQISYVLFQRVGVREFWIGTLMYCGVVSSPGRWMVYLCVLATICMFFMSECLNGAVLSVFINVL